MVFTCIKSIFCPISYLIEGTEEKGNGQCSKMLQLSSMQLNCITRVERESYALGMDIITIIIYSCEFICKLEMTVKLDTHEC